ncbi:unnamed protein product, partial [marine sediment metagenome]
MYKEPILSYLLEYLKHKKIPYKKSGKVVMIQCPFCNKEPMSANKIPNTNIVNCFNCKDKKKYNVIDIVMKLENKKNEEDAIQYLKELFNINIITKKDETEIEKLLDYYEKNAFDLVPIAKDDKRPIEKDWTNKEHKDKNEWKTWLNNGLNIGVKTGTRSKITIIDIDQKPIPEEIKKAMGKTLMQESTNGFHLFYKYEESLPKSRIDELKIDIENNGGQVVIAPSKVKGISRKIALNDIAQMPKELLELLKSKTTVPRQTQSEKIREDIQTENFKIDPTKFALKNNNLEGSCN